jgi:hypothetical protein
VPEAPASPAAPEGLAALGSSVGEVEVFDRERSAAVGLGEGDELADGGPHSPISGGGTLVLQVKGDRD